ncbi:MAG: SDR family NAD(P)-dependent oxidoreductase [Muribaculaceae bacterium]|nr:SDR family NAD(P)-dependent oxidoreductase [Muribaculaceae bacterium]
MKKVVIMGASSGMGYGVAEALASRGVKIGIAARHTAPLKALKEKYPEFVEYAKIDITKPEAVSQLNDLIEELGGMDIYFHVAGIYNENLYLDPETDVKVANTNCCGFARMISAAYRYFRTNKKKGQIAAITSVAGTKGIGRLAAYSSSKKFGQWYLDAVEQMSNAEKTGITFTDIRPGWVRTPLENPDENYPMNMTVDYVVPMIIKAIVKKYRVAVVDWRWNIFTGIWRSIPQAIWVKINPTISTPDPNYPSVGAMQEEVHELGLDE